MRIGAVVSVNPARRQVRLQIAGSYTPTLEGIAWLYTKLRSGQVLKSKVEKVHAVGTNPIVTLVPGVPRDTVAQMMKAVVVVDRSDVVRSSVKYDLTELEGLKLESADGQLFGRVITTFTTPAHGMMEVQQDGGSLLLMPAIPQVIQSVDWDRGRVLVGDIEPYAVGSDEDDDAPVTGVDV